MENRKCPVWGTPAITQRQDLDWILSDSIRMGGRYMISDMAEAMLASEDENTKARLTTWVIEQRRLGIELPRVVKSTIRDAVTAIRMPVQRRADRFLEFLEKYSKNIGSRVFIAATPDSKYELFAITESYKDEEIVFLLAYLKKSGFLLSSSAAEYVSISVAGYQRLDETKRIRIISSQAFVAMWFDASLSDAYSAGIKPGIEDAGYTAVRVDAVDHNNKIDDTIIAEIRRSRFLVADFTHGDKGHRGGVYYEAGFAHGLNIPVIFTCREDIMSEVHFDTRQYNHITWKEPAELREKLSKRISATIGDGPDRKAP